MTKFTYVSVVNVDTDTFLGSVLVTEKTGNEAINAAQQILTDAGMWQFNCNVQYLHGEFDSNSTPHLNLEPWFNKALTFANMQTAGLIPVKMRDMEDQIGKTSEIVDKIVAALKHEGFIYQKFDKWVSGMREDFIVHDEVENFKKTVANLLEEEEQSTKRKLEVALRNVITAWESVEPGQTTPRVIQAWLQDHMSPAIKQARIALDLPTDVDSKGRTASR